MANYVEFMEGKSVVFVLNIPENLEGELQVDGSTLSGQAIGSMTCPVCGGTALTDGPDGPAIPGTCNCPA